MVWFASLFWKLRILDSTEAWFSIRQKKNPHCKRNKIAKQNAGESIWFPRRNIIFFDVWPTHLASVTGMRCREKLLLKQAPSQQRHNLHLVSALALSTSPCMTLSFTQSLPTPFNTAQHRDICTLISTVLTDEHCGMFLNGFLLLPMHSLHCWPIC